MCVDMPNDPSSPTDADGDASALDQLPAAQEVRPQDGAAVRCSALLGGTDSFVSLYQLERSENSVNLSVPAANLTPEMFEMLISSLAFYGKSELGLQFSRLGEQLGWL